MLAEGRVRFQATRFTDAFLIEAERALDARGYFMRTYCARAFAERGLETTFVQDSTSFSKLRGTVRGMHFQKAPHEEVKVVRCLKGAILDVIIDVRPTSWTFLQAQAFELSADNERQLYIPKGFAHGFQTLVDDVLVGYMISAYYAPESATGLRYDDPACPIKWPLTITEINDKDRAWADFAVDQRRSK
ncbi:MAG: dTDP-4-dehydrorhamnose 3,5-epimerase [Hyphomicrobiaceae bacterium]